MSEPPSGVRAADGPREEATVAALVQRATDQITRLVRDELALARAELTTDGIRAGSGAAMVGGAGGMALFGTGALVAALVLVLAGFLPAWVAALVVAVVLFAVAGLLALVGRRQVKQTTPVKPESTLHSVRADAESVRQAARKGRGR
ncbi:phage holin family protein [Micromonospora sp. C31]|uniref:phage holin family protein n=1 Tax=Micromonospora sp. C31 TaxID=2824876 RepID=UPI001B36E394|nr:phage holin family protein [Micromonospora sp. C31]MBQ1075404.1 phage holin family protein [Micromonospora sp. C31]